MIGTLSTVITLVCGIFAIKYFDDSDLNGGPYSCLIILSTIHLPLILSLTIKHHKNQTTKVAPTLPKTLQFHEENPETSGQLEESPEINEESRDNTLDKDEFQQEKDNNTNQDTNQNTLTVQRSKSPDALSLFDTEFD